MVHLQATGVVGNVKVYIVKLTALPRLADHAHAHHLLEPAHTNGTWSRCHPHIAHHMLSARSCTHEYESARQRGTRLFVVSCCYTQQLLYERRRLIQQACIRKVMSSIDDELCASDAL